ESMAKKDGHVSTPATTPTPERSSPGLPPSGPRGNWLVGWMRQLQRDPLGLYAQANRQYGHYVRPSGQADCCPPRGASDNGGRGPRTGQGTCGRRELMTEADSKKSGAMTPTS